MNSSQPLTIEDNVVVTLNYSLVVDGDVVDSSDEGDPIEFIQGKGMVIRGLEQALYGVAVGDSKRFIVLPAEGYGEHDPDAYAEVPVKEFPEDFPLEPGVELLLKDEEGDEMEAHIVSVGDDSVVLDFNHPLAGKELDFSVQVVALRWATDEELDHGHVHTEEPDDNHHH
jgi:FKBP-type peptidyl-prolyl cis-trans isomerase SlyD